MPSRAELRKTIFYDPMTGAFYDIQKHRRLETRVANFYYGISLNGRRYYAHRLAWIYANGPLPAGQEIDHINHDGFDNRIANLRAITHQQNMRNRSKPKNNKSGHQGVHWVNRRGIWRATIKVDREILYLGSFSSLDLAVAARVEAERKYDFHTSHGR